MNNVSINILSLRALNFLTIAWRLRERVYASVSSEHTVVLTVLADAAWPTHVAGTVLDTGITVEAAPYTTLDAASVASALDLPDYFIKVKAARSDKAEGISVTSAGVEFFAFLHKLPEPSIATFTVFDGGMGEA